GRGLDAAARWTRAARECGDVESALHAAGALQSARRCPDGIALLRELWPKTSSDAEQVELLDAVTGCSDSFTLSKNLAFVPADTRERYYALLDARERQRREEERQER